MTYGVDPAFMNEGDVARAKKPGVTEPRRSQIVTAEDQKRKEQRDKPGWEFPLWGPGGVLNGSGAVNRQPITEHTDKAVVIDVYAGTMTRADDVRYDIADLKKQIAELQATLDEAK